VLNKGCSEVGKCFRRLHDYDDDTYERATTSHHVFDDRVFHIPCSHHSGEKLMGQLVLGRAVSNRSGS
jgi:hypothetical protein